MSWNFRIIIKTNNYTIYIDFRTIRQLWVFLTRAHPLKNRAHPNFFWSISRFFLFLQYVNVQANLKMCNAMFWRIPWLISLKSTINFQPPYQNIFLIPPLNSVHQDGSIGILYVSIGRTRTEIAIFARGHANHEV